MSRNKCHAEGKNRIVYKPEGGTFCLKCKCLSPRITVTLADPQEDDMAGETYVLIVWTHPNTQTSCPLRVMAPHASRTRRPETGVNSHRLHKVAHRVLEPGDPTRGGHTYGSARNVGITHLFQPQDDRLHASLRKSMVRHMEQWGNDTNLM